jgi:hypothetical protein
LVVFDGEPPFLMVQSCSITTATMRGPQTIAKLVNISPISIYFNMVYDTFIYFWHLLTIYGSINQRYPKVTSQKGAQWNPNPIFSSSIPCRERLSLRNALEASHLPGGQIPLDALWLRLETDLEVVSASTLKDAGVEALEYPCPQKRITVLNRKGNWTTKKRCNHMVTST